MKSMTLSQVQQAAATVIGRESWEPCSRSDDRAWRRRVSAFLDLKLAAESGNGMAVLAVQEAMSSDDFPNLLGDTLNREVQEKYKTWPKVWEGVAQRRQAKDYRTLKTFAPNSLNGLMSKVGASGANTPAQNKADRTPVSYSVEDYSTYAAVNRKAIVNDDVGEFASIPSDFSESAINTEGYEFTSKFVGVSGPTGLTQLTSNPVFTVPGLKAAFTQLFKLTDSVSGMPILLEAPTIMVGPGLSIDAREVVKATAIELINSGTTDRRLLTENWIASAISKVIVNPWFAYIMTSNEDTAWCAFAEPRPGRACIEAAFLIGREEPRVYVKSSDQQRVGGGMAPVTDGQFSDPNVHYKCEHTFAFAIGNSQLGFMSNGTGS